MLTLILAILAYALLPASTLAWLAAHPVVVALAWVVGSLAVNLLFAHISPVQLVALFAKNRWGALAIGLLRGVGIDPAQLLATLQHFLDAKRGAVTPVVVAQLPVAVQAVVKDPALLALLESHARVLLAKRA